MNPKLRKLITNWRIIILALFIIVSIVAINPTSSDGVAIRSVALNSSAQAAGIPQPRPNIQPVDRERILSVNNNKINDVDDYYSQIANIAPNRTIQIRTNSGPYRLTTREKVEIIQLNETEQKIITETIEKNITVNGTIKTVTETAEKAILVPKTKKISRGTEDIGIKVYQAPKTNIRKGLDLQGGTRVLLQPEAKLSPYDMGVLLDNMKERLNVYGLSDLNVREANDLPPPIGTGNQYIVVEIAGATEEEIRDLLARQGKFEAKIGSSTVFRGGQDIVYVGRSANDIRVECRSNNVCDFSFSVTISRQAAENFAEITKNMQVINDPDSRSSYLSEKMDLYLDDVIVSSLNIVSNLKGKAETTISITGSEAGNNLQDAQIRTQNEMKRLQTVLTTGSLPVKLNIVKTDSISPALGEEFVKNAIIMSLFAILAVSIVLIIRYRKMIIAVPIFITMISEVTILLGVAAIIKQNMDMAAIAGILVAIGTGVDDQIVITDETLKGETANIFSWKEKVKRAFLIIMLAYLTVVVAMIPLIFAGAGLLKGFAITTIIGVTIGVFVTRPAYSAFVEIMLK